MLPMTKVEGVPDNAAVRPGMAFFCGTGPAGSTCGGCKHKGYSRESRNGTFNEATQTIVHRSYRVSKCAIFKQMAGHHGADVENDNPSCKYFEARPK